MQIGELIEYIVTKIDSKLIRLKLNKCGDMFYIGPGSRLAGLKSISVGNNFYAGRGFWMEGIYNYAGEKYTPILKIGDNFCAAHNVHISINNSLEIGNNVLIGSKVLITDHTHGAYDLPSIDNLKIPPINRKLSKNGFVIVEDNVWICDGAVIAAGVTIGKGSIIGPNSVVSKNVDQYSLVSGNPAKIIKHLI